MTLRMALGFLLFFIGFFTASIYHFSTFVERQDHSFKVVSLLLGIFFVSGFFLAQSLSKLMLFPRKMWKKIIYGGLLGIAVSAALFCAEDVLSKKKLYDDFKENSFSELYGHCGVYAGRAIIHAWRVDWSRSLAHLLADYEAGDRCRMKHFQELSHRNRLCAENEDEVLCRIRYMNIFSKKGFWNVAVREMFLDEVVRIYQKDAVRKIPLSSWAQYLLKDQELNFTHSSLVRQVGLEEQFTPEYLFLKLQEELQELLTTRRGLEELEKIVPEDAWVDPPELMEYF